MQVMMRVSAKRARKVARRACLMEVVARAWASAMVERGILSDCWWVVGLLDDCLWMWMC